MNSLSDTALSAANCYRAVDLLIDEFERINPEDPRGIELFDRFLDLHREFYDYIIILTSEDSGEIDQEFAQEVLDEHQELKSIIQSLKEEKGFLEGLGIKLIGKSNKVADYFANCVEAIFNGYGIDQDTNEIFFVYED